MGSEVVVLGGLVLLGGLVWLWHMTFSVDPRIHPHPFVLRWLEPRWERWEDLDWDVKMRIFRLRQVVNWVFVILVMALLVMLFGLAAQSNAPASQPAVAAAAPAVTLAAHGSPFGVAVSADGRYAVVTLTSTGEVALYSRPEYRLAGVALIDGGAVAAVADSARFARPPVASTVTFVSTAAILAGRPALLGTLPGGKFPREFALSPHGRQLLLTEFRSEEVAVFDVGRLPRPR